MTSITVNDSLAIQSTLRQSEESTPSSEPVWVLDGIIHGQFEVDHFSYDIKEALHLAAGTPMRAREYEANLTKQYGKAILLPEGFDKVLRAVQSKELIAFIPCGGLLKKITSLDVRLKGV